MKNIALILIIFTIFFSYKIYSVITRPSGVPDMPQESGVQEIRKTREENQVKIGEDIIFVDIADEHEERIQGLSGRASLEGDRGMLFLFEKADRYGFWMKGMLFPIDIIWIKGETIVDFSENLPPAINDSPPLYHPQEPADKVLEINAGQVKSRGFKIGDSVEFLLR